MQVRVYLAVLLSLALIIGLTWIYVGRDSLERINSVGRDGSPETVVNSEKISLPEQLPSSISQPAQAKETPPIETTPEVSPAEPKLQLPELNQSDLFVREHTTPLSVDTRWSDWLARDELIRRFVVIVENAARGEVPRRQLGFVAPQGSFKVKKQGGKIYLDSQSYARYDSLVNTVLSLPVATSAQLLSTLQPLIEEGLRELGVKEADGNALLQSAIDQVLATPVLQSEIELKQPKVFYQFADSQLESLTPLQKQIMRMGPSNTLRLQTFCRRLVLALEGNML
jgi:hypothetical protein